MGVFQHFLPSQGQGIQNVTVWTVSWPQDPARQALLDVDRFWVSDYNDDDYSDILCWIPSILAVTFHNAIIISLTWMHNSHLQQPEVRLP